MFLLLLAAALTAGPDSLPDCGPRVPRSAVAYAAASAEALAGGYDLTLVDTKSRTAHAMAGRLALLVADSVHRWTVAPLSGSGPRARGLERPLWGAVEFTGRPFPDSQPLALRDPDEPTVVLVADGRLLLRWPRPAIFHLELRIERTSPDGFWGHWSEGRGLQATVSTGPDPGRSAGYFCATRRSGTGAHGA